MKTKPEMISFKADAALKEALAGIPNRSEFIRDAVLAALENACPLCHGTGILSPSQKEHMNQFLVNHSLEKCQDCQEMVFRCRK
ncbi:MAG: CopG family transcriptional regulator [Deltaproteobacteria bacterium]|nr:CopG family transcriptional regulator [Deltaproteobacteria bacterium]